MNLSCTRSYYMEVRFPFSILITLGNVANFIHSNYTRGVSWKCRGVSATMEHSNILNIIRIKIS